MTEHALLAPSAAHRWVECPGSVMLQQAYPSIEGLDAQEGTACHWAALCIRNGRTPAAGELAPNGIALNDEMIEAAEVFVDTFRAIVAKWPPDIGAHFVMERRIDIPRVHREHAWGTPDLRGWVPGNTLHVFDLKYGHRIVEPYENWQLVMYAAGVLEERGRRVGDEDVTLVLTVVQPRAPHPDGPVRSWTCKASDIRTHVNRLQMAGDAALSTDPPTRAGPWCRDCSAQRVCVTAQREGLRIADEVAGAVTFDPTPQAVGLELRWLKRSQEFLDARVSALEEQASAMLKGGQSVPFWRLEATPGREAWTVPLEDVLGLGVALDVPLGKLAVITPNQARKAGIPPEVVATMSDRPKSALKLLPDDGRKARQVFTGN